jgi:hypothetical protein
MPSLFPMLRRRHQLPRTADDRFVGAALRGRPVFDPPQNVMSGRPRRSPRLPNVTRGGHGVPPLQEYYCGPNLPLYSVE